MQTTSSKNSVNLVWRRLASEEKSSGLKISVVSRIANCCVYCCVVWDYMSWLIANQVKTNMCCVSAKLIIVHITFVPLCTLHWYNNNYNNNLLSSLLLAAYNLFVSTALIRYSSHTTIRYSAHNLFVSVNLYSLGFYNTQPQLKTDWLQLHCWSLYLALL